MVLERAHLLELLFDPAAAFQSQFHQFGQFLLGKLAVRVDQLDHPRNGLAHGLHVAGVQVEPSEK